MKNINTSFKLNLLKKALIIITITGAFFACKKNKPEFVPDCNGTPKSFSADVNPIIQASCATDSDCHGAGSNSGVGELLTYTKIFSVRSEIRSAVASGAMPLDGSLTSTEKNAILCWIDSGAPAN